MVMGRILGIWVGLLEVLGREIGRWRVYIIYYIEGNFVREWSCFV